MFQFIKKEKNNLIIALMSLAIISSLGIEAGQFRDLNSFIYFNITLNVDDKNFLIPVLNSN